MKFSLASASDLNRCLQSSVCYLIFFVMKLFYSGATDHEPLIGSRITRFNIRIMQFFFHIVYLYVQYDSMNK